MRNVFLEKWPSMKVVLVAGAVRDDSLGLNRKPVTTF